MDFPVGQYKTIYLDPPWPERGGGKIKRGADRHYKLMTVKEIQALPIINLVHPDGAHIYLWVTNNYLQAGLDCLRAWQFEYITTITWMKDRQGLGQYYRGLTEHCLFGSTKKRLPYRLTEDGRRCQGVTGFLEAKTVHSAKPDKMREMIETVSHPPRIELFARKHFAGWDVWGEDLKKPWTDLPNLKGSTGRDSQIEKSQESSLAARAGNLLSPDGESGAGICHTICREGENLSLW